MNILNSFKALFKTNKNKRSKKSLCQKLKSFCQGGHQVSLSCERTLHLEYYTIEKASHPTLLRWWTHLKKLLWRWMQYSIEAVETGKLTSQHHPPPPPHPLSVSQLYNTLHSLFPLWTIITKNIYMLLFHKISSQSSLYSKYTCILLSKNLSEPLTEPVLLPY